LMRYLTPLGPSAFSGSKRKTRRTLVLR
jgi:hypothetical protein